MEASIINHFSNDLSQYSYSSKESYRKLLNAYTELPGVTLDTIATIRSADFGDVPLTFVRYTPLTRKARPRLKVLITAGIHGDEPAGVLALYKYLLSISLRELDIEVCAFPCINPIGLLRNSRVSSGHFDLNRQMDPRSIAPEVRAVTSQLISLGQTFDVAFDLHEDNPAVPCDFGPEAEQADGFYAYESNFNPLSAPIGKAIVQAIAAKGIQVSGQRTIYGERATHGVVERGIERTEYRDLERYLTMNFTDRVITSETLITSSLEERISAQVTVLEAGCSALRT
jgi:protein MpaA